LNRDRLGRKCAALAAILGVVFVCGWAAVGFTSGVMFAVAIGAATAVAVFGDPQRTCSPRFLRRRG
jgi:hypothetical protein